MNALDNFYKQDDSYSVDSNRDLSKGLPKEEQKFDYPKHDYNAIIKTKLVPAVSDKPSVAKVIDPAFQTTRADITKLKPKSNPGDVYIQDFDPHLDTGISSGPVTKNFAQPIRNSGAQVVPVGGVTNDGYYNDPNQQYRSFQVQQQQQYQPQQYNQYSDQNGNNYTDQQPYDPNYPEVNKPKGHVDFSPDVDNSAISEHASTHHSHKKKKRKSLMSQLSIRSFYTMTETTIEPTENFRDGLFDCFKNL